MANSRYEIDIELPNRLTSDEYDAARENLNNAILWYLKGNDKRVRDFLICAISELKGKGEYHAANVVNEYLKFF